METSIEEIWREGFVDEKALLAPRVNDLYRRKSRHIIDRLIRSFRINLLCIVAFATVLLGATILAGLPVIGVGTALLLGWLVVVGRRQLALLERIDKGDSSYDYLKAFDRWVKDKMAVYARIYRVFYPALLLVVVFGLRYSHLGDRTLDRLLAEYPDLPMVLGLPVYGLMATAVVAGLLGCFAGAIYRQDVNIVYGRQLARLEEIIADMEELKRD